MFAAAARDVRRLPQSGKDENKWHVLQTTMKEHDDTRIYLQKHVKAYIYYNMAV